MKCYLEMIIMRNSVSYFSFSAVDVIDSNGYQFRVSGVFFPLAEKVSTMFNKLIGYKGLKHSFFENLLA